MNKVEIDVLKTKKMILSNNEKDYKKLYFKSNENLPELFSNFSLKDKDVLTVLASSDQYFYSYYLGAKTVDSFDNNKLAEYYHYIRKWLLQYKKQFYPNKEDIVKSTQWIYDLLCLVKCESQAEMDAFNYWSRFIESIPAYFGKELFYFSEHYDSTIEDISSLNKILANKNLVFKHQDISKEIDKSKKYDVVILSNILEYLTSDDIKESRDNLYSILKDDGIVVCSCVLSRLRSYQEEIIFRDKFDVYNYNFSNDIWPYNTRNLGYCYKKK